MANRNDDVAIEDTESLADLQKRHEKILAKSIDEDWPDDRRLRAGQKMAAEVYRSILNEENEEPTYN